MASQSVNAAIDKLMREVLFLRDCWDGPEAMPEEERKRLPIEVIKQHRQEHHARVAAARLDLIRAVDHDVLATKVE